MDFYVDVDGTLLASWLDDQFKVNGFAWYSRQYVNNLPVNVDLVNELRRYSANGHRIFLWTNRGQNQVKMTMENIASFIDIFSGFCFYDGRKMTARVDGIVIDNEEKYRICGTDFVHVNFQPEERRAA